MLRPSLLAWQWSDYSAKHQHRGNLALHMFAVPLFIAGMMAVGFAIAHTMLLTAVLGLGAMLISMLLQAQGHKLEREAPTPFNGPMDFATRFLAEQWITFPRFVLTGQWTRNLLRMD